MLCTTCSMMFKGIQLVQSTCPQPRATLRKAFEVFVLLLSPFAPHIAEELWQRLGHPHSLAHEPWPAFDPAALETDSFTLVVQVNGKVRTRLSVPSRATE